MNPASRIWDIPPPPGTEEFDLELSNKEDSIEKPDDKAEEKSSLRAIDRIDPYLKNPEYVDYEKRHRSKKSRSRSRSKSKERHRRRRYSRSRSRSRHRRSRSKSRRHRRRYSSSHSRSRSPSHRHSRHKRSRRRRSSSPRHSRSRSPSTSKSHYRHRRTRSPKEKPPSASSACKSETEEQPLQDADINEVDMKIEEEEEEDDIKDNVFKNDGSFLEMFKKMQEQQQQQKVKEEPVSSLGEIKKPVLPVFGKRRGGKVLKTGMVQKIRQPSEEENNAQDAWSIYMKEVRRYKEAHCDDDSKTRPLVK